MLQWGQQLRGGETVQYILNYLFLFSVGSMLGWVLEVFFRRFFSRNDPERKWINPGFLNGPCLPLYGFGLCFLYLLAGIDLSAITNTALRYVVTFFLMAAAMTLIEYIAGLIFVKGMNVKLWDYSQMWGNIQGIICPLFSFFWAVLAAVYYFLIHPHVTGAVLWFVGHPLFSFVIGVFYGLFFVDFAVSVNLLAKLRKFASDNGIIVKYEELKAHSRKLKEERREKLRFLFAFRSSNSFAEQMKKFREDGRGFEPIRRLKKQRSEEKKHD